MITHFLARSGYAADLPCLKGRRFEFGPGLNVLYGPNGSGKSTILNVIAGHCGVKNGGWSRFPEPRWSGKTGDRFPASLVEQYVPGKCEADVGWDGTPTFLGHTKGDSDSMALQPGYDAEDSEDGMTSFEDQISIRFSHPSNGQLRMGKLHLWAEKIKQGGTKFDGIPKDRRVNSVWEEHWRAWVEYCVSLGQKGPRTILLDEPERSLSMEFQALVWQNLIFSAAKAGLQVIVATHSLVPVLLKGKRDMVWHDLEEGHGARTLEVVNQLLAGEAVTLKQEPPSADDTEKPAAKKPQARKQS